MSKKRVSYKGNKRLIEIAIANGANIVNGKGHTKIYDGNVLVAVVSHGLNRDRVPGGTDRIVLKRFQQRGWKI